MPRPDCFCSGSADGVECCLNLIHGIIFSPKILKIERHPELGGVLVRRGSGGVVFGGGRMASDFRLTKPIRIWIGTATIPILHTVAYPDDALMVFDELRCPITSEPQPINRDLIGVFRPLLILPYLSTGSWEQVAIFGSGELHTA